MTDATPQATHAGMLVADALCRARNRKFVVTQRVYEFGGLTTTPAESRAMARTNLALTVDCYGRNLRLIDRRYRRRLQGTIDVRGLEHLERAASRRRGVILAAAHVGDFDLAGSWIVEVFGLRLVVAVAPIAQRSRQLYFDRVRRACGFTLLRQNTTRLADLAGDLAAGAAVILMIDRRISRATAEVRFLGHRAAVATAPYRLSAMTGAPVLTAATWGQSDGRRVLRFSECASYAETDAVTMTQRLALEIEGVIRTAPSQWHVPADAHELPWLRAIESQAVCDPLPQ